MCEQLCIPGMPVEEHNIMKFLFWKAQLSHFNISALNSAVQFAHILREGKDGALHLGPLQNLPLSDLPSSVILAVSFPTAIRTCHILIDTQWSGVSSHTSEHACVNRGERVASMLACQAVIKRTQLHKYRSADAHMNTHTHTHTGRDACSDR